MDRPAFETASANGTKAQSVSGRRVLVVGLGRFGGGVGVTQWLVSHGAHVTVTDRAGADALAESVEAVAGLGVTLRLGGHDPADLADCDLVVLNPAVDKNTSQFFREVLWRRIPWTTEMNLFCERCPARIVGLTGTFGKSTTCGMLAEVLGACRRRGDAPYSGVHLGGNIGRSLLTELPRIVPTDIVVLEMSNAQLEDLPRIRWAPPVAVVTNLFPHHLDRYGSFNGYATAKLNIVRDPSGASKIIVGELHPEAEAMLSRLIPDGARRVVRIRPPDPAVELNVLGRHNQQNAACVLTVCRELGLEETAVREALSAFRGLPHRLEYVRTLDGVDYYNDSKSTAPAATITAVESFDRPIVVIVGGQRKAVSLTECAQLLVRTCRAVICTGESGPHFAEAVRKAAGNLPAPLVLEMPTLPDAVRESRRAARSGDVVLFSPGAPSFDQFANFTERGRYFVDLVQGL